MAHQLRGGPDFHEVRSIPAASLAGRTVVAGHVSQDEWCSRHLRSRRRHLWTYSVRKCESFGFFSPCTYGGHGDAGVASAPTGDNTSTPFACPAASFTTARLRSGIYLVVVWCCWFLSIVVVRCVAGARRPCAGGAAFLIGQAHAPVELTPPHLTGFHGSSP